MEWWNKLGKKIVKKVAVALVGMALDLVLDWGIEFFITLL